MFMMSCTAENTATFIYCYNFQRIYSDFTHILTRMMV
ncbi:hypothetical protein M622_15930 [Thauera terpenica 58Eu]|uniref:Uncharacterized protein n=1 Tax=Thauera terpenica 58Eu TaxID=1348657 RepID=S9ZLB4_9RHOO|nr:hypothetical protein M622_15930 [Thauera terpenica 58Eu]